MCLYSKVKSEQKSRCGTTTFSSKSVTYPPGLHVYTNILPNLPMNSAAQHPQGESPHMEKPALGKPTLEKPMQAKPILENPAQLSTK